jgi:hypothetical protein
MFTPIIRVVRTAWILWQARPPAIVDANNVVTTKKYIPSGWFFPKCLVNNNKTAIPSRELLFRLIHFCMEIEKDPGLNLKVALPH